MEFRTSLLFQSHYIDSLTMDCICQKEFESMSVMCKATLRPQAAQAQTQTSDPRNHRSDIELRGWSREEEWAAEDHTFRNPCPDCFFIDFTIFSFGCGTVDFDGQKSMHFFSFVFVAVFELN